MRALPFLSLKPSAVLTDLGPAPVREAPSTQRVTRSRAAAAAAAAAQGEAASPAATTEAVTSPAAEAAAVPTVPDGRGRHMDGRDFGALFHQAVEHIRYELSMF